MTYTLRGLFWIGLYVGLATTPTFLLLLGPTPEGRGFWWEFQVALAFAGAVVMGMMFYLTARYRRAVSPFGMDAIYYFHRWMAVVAMGLITLHVILIFSAKPELVSILAPGTIPMSMRTGLVAAASLAVLVGTSVWRKALGIDYEVWRRWHFIFSVTAVVFAILHMELVGYYVSAPWKNWFWLGLGVSWTGSMAYLHIARPLGMARRPYRVVEVRREQGCAWTLGLEAEGHQGMFFRAGQFVWLSLGRSPFAFEKHPFSIASSSERGERIELIIKELGDFTSRIGEARPGERAYIEGPYGTFCPDRHDAQGYFLLAGGIGIAPMMSILRTFADREDRRSITLLYGAGTLEGMTCREEIESLQVVLNLVFVPVLMNPPEGWEGEKGFIDEVVLQRHLPDHRGSCEYFICGPVPMKNSVERGLNRQRVPMEKIHSELFDWV